MHFRILRAAALLTARGRRWEWLQESYSKFCSLLHREGVQRACWLALKRALRPLVEVRRHLIFEADLMQPPERVSARIPLNIRTATADDFETFAAELVALRLRPEVMHRRLIRGHECIIAFSGPHLVNLTWLSYFDLLLGREGILVHVGEREVFSFNSVTLPAWRGQGVLPAVFAFVNQHARSKGCVRHFTHSTADNWPALHALAKMRLKRNRTVWVVSALGKQWSFPRVPRSHER